MKATSSLLKLLAAVVAAVITTSCSFQIQVLPDGSMMAYSSGPCGRMPIFRQMPPGCSMGYYHGQQMVFRQGRPFGYWGGQSSCRSFGGGMPPRQMGPPEPPYYGGAARPVRVGQIQFSDRNPGGIWVGQ